MVKIWIIAHLAVLFKDTTSPFNNCKEVIAQLNKEFKQTEIENYEKRKSGYYGLLKFKLEQAIANAKKLEKQLSESNNPSTTVHHLVTHLQAEKKV